MKKIPCFLGITAGVLSLGMFLAPVSAGEAEETARMTGTEGVTPTPVIRELPGEDVDSDLDFYLDMGGENADYSCEEILYVPSGRAVLSGAGVVEAWQSRTGEIIPAPDDPDGGQDYYLKADGENVGYESVEIMFVPSSSASAVICVTPTPMP